MQDPANRTPPVDTVFVYPPLNALEAHHLCFAADLEPAKQAVETTMQARLFLHPEQIATIDGCPPCTLSLCAAKPTLHLSKKFQLKYAQHECIHLEKMSHASFLCSLYGAVAIL